MRRRGILSIEQEQQQQRLLKQGEQCVEFIEMWFTENHHQGGGESGGCLGLSS
jgi:hypothetical protein